MTTHEAPTKEGSRGVHELGLANQLGGKHKRAQLGGGFRVVPPSPDPSGGEGASGVLQKELCCHCCRILSRLSRFRGSQFVVTTS